MQKLIDTRTNDRKAVNKKNRFFTLISIREEILIYTESRYNSRNYIHFKNHRNLSSQPALKIP